MLGTVSADLPTTAPSADLPAGPSAGPSADLPAGPAAGLAAGLSGGFDGLIGLRFDHIGPDRVTASLPITAQLLQPYGIVHGGVLCTMVETTASVGAAMWFGDRGNVVGVANHTDFLRASRQGTLSAVATPIHRGRTQQLWQVDITDEHQHPVARGQLRVANLDDAGRLGHRGSPSPGPTAETGAPRQDP